MRWKLGLDEYQLWKDISHNIVTQCCSKFEKTIFKEKQSIEEVNRTMLSKSLDLYLIKRNGTNDNIL